MTGVGLVTPTGGDAASSWQGLVDGQSRAIGLDDWNEAAYRGFTGSSALRFAGLPAAVCLAHSSHVDPVCQLAQRVVSEAVGAAKLTETGIASDRIGCVFGTSKGGLFSAARLVQSERSPSEADQNDEEERALLWQQMFPSHPATVVMAEHGWTGPCIVPIAACATGLHAVIQAADLIRRGVCDVVIAGSADASLLPAVLGCFSRLRVLARCDGDPATAIRPFDAERTGFLVGEGAGVVVLERMSHAQDRGATLLAEWLTGGTAADATGLTTIDEQGHALAYLIGTVIQRAGLSPQQIDYVQMHGTGTQQNDKAESAALLASLGDHARAIPCSSFKGTWGHLLGAAGGAEVAATVLALQHQIVPPTVNWQTRDPACPLDYVPGQARAARIDHALKLSLGFGGHLAAGLLRRV